MSYRSIRADRPYLILAGCLILVTISVTSVNCARSISQQVPRDSALGQLVLGIAQGGDVFLEVPISPAFYGPPKSDPNWRFLASDSGEEGDERDRIRGQLFSQLFQQRAKLTYVPAAVDYWGSKVDPKLVNQTFLSDAVQYRTGEMLNMIGPSGRAQLRIVDLEVRCNELDQRCIILGVAKPIDVTVRDHALVVASREVFRCNPCTVEARQPAEELFKRIRNAALSGAWLTRGVGDVVAQEGHFTTGEQEYLAFLGGTTDEVWKTVLLDRSLSVRETLGEASYLRIIPQGVSDINNDGLNEIWVRLQGMEGFSDGLIYYVGGSGPRKFRLLKTALNGM